MDTTQDIVGRIRAVMKKENYTQSDLARRLRVTNAQVYGYLHKKNGCYFNLRTLCRISEAMRVPLAVFILQTEFTNYLSDGPSHKQAKTCEE